MTEAMNFFGPGGLLLALVLVLGLFVFFGRHALRRAHARWKLHRERTRVRREYWGYE